MGRALGICGAALVSIGIVVAPVAGQSPPGVPPRDATHCPDEQPVKGYASQRGVGGGVFYVPGSPQYDRAAPERCFATEGEARQAGYRSGREDRRPARDRR